MRGNLFDRHDLHGYNRKEQVREVKMLEKIGFYSLLSLIAIVWIWVMFVVTPVMIETAMSALEMWKEIL